jgi:hypothetical protein
LAFLPIFHAILSRRSDLLLSRRTYISAIIVISLTAPWYLLTYKIASGGFNYSWGFAYTRVAFGAFTDGLPALLGVVGLVALFLAAIVIEKDVFQDYRDETALSCMAGSIGIFVFICLVPADISTRYLIDLLPCALVTAVLGLDRSIRLTFPAIGLRRQWTALTAVLVLNAVVMLDLPHLATFGMDDVARTILGAGSDNPLVLISGSTRTEGALVAAFAEKDRIRSHYIIRGTKVMASSDFMGRDYKLRFDDVAALEHWIEDNKIGWIVIVDTALLPAMPHMRQMMELEATHPAQWSLIAEQKTETNDTRIFRVSSAPPTSAEVAKVLKQVAPTQIVGGN